MDFCVKMWRFKPYFDVFLERFLASARKKWILMLKCGVLGHSLFSEKFLAAARKKMDFGVKM